MFSPPQNYQQRLEASSPDMCDKKKKCGTVMEGKNRSINLYTDTREREENVG